MDLIGLSIMTGGHIPICRKLRRILEEKGAGDKLVFVGGVIPTRDFEALKALGVKGIFPGGTPLQETIDFIRSNVA